MQKIKFKVLLILIMLGAVSSSSFAQFNSGNVSSPYSQFGVGDLRTQGTAANRSMGGVGIALIDPIMANTINPAANSAVPRQSFFFAIGGEGINNYLSTSTESTSKNGANLSYISLRLPIANKLGFSFSMSPYSSVGYAMRVVDTRDDVVSNIGSVTYLYSGDGDIAEYKAGFGWEIFKNFSFGANFIYYLGNLDRDIEIQTNPYVSNTAYSLVIKSDIENYNMPSFELGAQYSFAISKNSGITIGGTFRPRLKDDIEMRFLTQSYDELSVSLDTLYDNKISNPFSIPQKIGAAINYNHSGKLNISLDYTNEQFSDSFSGQQLVEGVQYRDRSTYAMGMEFTPNRYDVRYYTRRMTYRFGARYANSYLTYNSNPINEFAISAGVGLPFNSLVFSSMNIGVEYMRRGSKDNGMISSNIFSFFFDVALFTNQQWFAKYKFE